MATKANGFRRKKDIALSGLINALAIYLLMAIGDHFINGRDFLSLSMFLIAIVIAIAGYFINDSYYYLYDNVKRIGYKIIEK